MKTTKPIQTTLIHWVTGRPVHEEEVDAGLEVTTAIAFNGDDRARIWTVEGGMLATRLAMVEDLESAGIVVERREVGV